MQLTKTLLMSLLLSLTFPCLSATDHCSDPPQEVVKMSPAQFQIYGSLSAVFDNFDFDAVCEVTGFRVVRIARRSDPVMVDNRGGIFSVATSRLVAQARSGDIYYFEEIRAVCPQDPASRPLAGLLVEVL